MEHVSVVFVHWGMSEQRSVIANQSLDSLIASTDIPLEIIVVHNRGEVWQHFQIHALELLAEKKISTYIENNDNFHFAYARNEGILMATAPKHLCIVDNDIIYQKGWLERCIELLEMYPDKNLIASPLRYPSHSRYVMERKSDHHFDMRAGSNCMVVPRKLFEKLGLFELHPISGTKFTDRIVRKGGYLTVVPTPNMAQDIQFRHGYNFDLPIDHRHTLHDGAKVEIKKFPLLNNFPA